MTTPNQSPAPDIPQGTQRAFWCRVLNEHSDKPVNRLLVYCNGYIAPLSDSQYEAPSIAVPHGEDFKWTGWVEEACEQCDTFWTFGGKVLSWMELPEGELLAPPPASAPPSGPQVSAQQGFNAEKMKQ